VALSCTGLGFVLSVVLGAPHELQASLLAALVTGAALASVTGAWKISFHAAAIVGAVAILVWGISWEMLVLAPLVPAVAWSRVALGRHTLAQALAGVAVGSALTILVLLLY
jgi:membrane-associated phospholipid phosphatase